MWKIDWNMLGKLSSNTKFNIEFNKELKALIGDNLITEVKYGDGCEIINISHQGLDGKIIVNGGNSPKIVGDGYSSGSLVFTQEESKALIKVEEDTKTGHNVEFYMFLGDRYDSLDEVTKAIEDYSETDGTEGIYYYEHHTVVEYTHKIEASEKLVGGFDQETLDKVNQILKMKGVEFTIKGDN